MLSRHRWSAALAAVVVIGVTIASLGLSSQTASAKDRLVLNGHAPRTVELSLRVSTNGVLRTSGTVWLNLTTNALRAQLAVPMFTSATAFSVRALGGRLYLTSPNLDGASGQVWYELHLTWPPLARLARLLLRPDAALLTLLANARTTHERHATTYEFRDDHFAWGTVGRSTSPGANGHLRVRLSTGSQGEVTGASASLMSPSAATSVSIEVLAYNRSVFVVAPPASRATTSATPIISQLLASGDLGALVLPAQWLRALTHAKLS